MMETRKALMSDEEVRGKGTGGAGKGRVREGEGSRTKDKAVQGEAR